MDAVIRYCAVAFLACCSTALAEDRKPPGDAVVVTTLRNPVAKSYRKMVEGAKHFEQRRHLAPDAALRFKLLPRQHETPMEGVRLRVEADSRAIPVNVAPDDTFTLELEREPKGSARVLSNRRAETMTWRADVRTPGLPPDTRRLGDLRLECEVGMKTGLISKYPRGFWDWLDELLPEGPDYCHRAQPNYLFFAERALFSVTLVDGARREVLSVERLYSGASRDPDWKKHLPHCDCAALLDRAYFVPLGDASWPDDTRVELEYMDGESPALGRNTKSDARAALGEAVVVDFASGYEVWVYRERTQEKKPASPPTARAELVLLFAPSGILAKTRVR